MIRYRTHIQSWKKKYFMPVTWTGILFLILDILLIRYYIRTDFGGHFSYTYAPFLELVCWIVIVVTNAVFILNLLLFLLSVIYLNWGVSAQTSRYFKFIQQDENNNLLKTSFPILVRPLLGYLQVQIEFDDDNISNQVFYIDKNTSAVNIALNNIQEYKINHLNVFIYDMLHFFQWRRKWEYDQSIIQYPVTIDDFPFKVKVDRYKKLEDHHTDNKISSPGEWLNFKDFETGDDVKRILWKIYAKNRVLMVRHRENVSFDNSESHVYCAFHITDVHHFWHNAYTGNYALDVYKNILWNTVNVLKKMEKSIIIHMPDYQGITHIDTFREKMVYQNWLEKKDTVWNIRYKGVTLFIPDVMSTSVLGNILEEYNYHISNIVLIETVHHIHEPMALKWIKKIFLRPSIDIGDETIKIFSDNVIKNKEELLRLIGDYSHVQVEVLKLMENMHQ